VKLNRNQHKTQIEEEESMQIRENASFSVSDWVESSVVDQQQGLPLLVQRKQDNPGVPAGSDGLLRLWVEQREWLDAQLYQYGAILFRGFEVSEQSIFQNVVAQLKEELLDYVDGNSPRTKVGGGVYTSTEYPPEYFISMHNELSYSAQWPARLFFCCVVEPEEGGQTPLVDSRSLLKNLPEALVEEFRSKKIRYIRNLHGGRGFGPSWQKTFQTSERAEIERYAESSGMDLHWNMDGSVSMANVRSATATHPLTRQEVWFNQADQFHPSTHPPAIYDSMLALYKGREDKLPQNATFGDGTPIPIEYLNTIRQTTRNQLALFPWQRGDLLMVDNMLAAHGRMPFKGQRRILVSMTAQ
jgi:alpha-ketoglutarate-dependent taurine dioxygenase